MSSLAFQTTVSRTRCYAYFLFWLSFTTFSGCAVTTHPLSDARDSQPDLRLLGRWELTDPHSHLIYTIDIERRAEKSNVLVVHPVGVRPMSASEVSSLQKNFPELLEENENSAKPEAGGKVSEAQEIAKSVAAEIKELGGAAVVELYCTRIAENYFVSLREISRSDQEDSVPSFMILRYQLFEDEIQLECFDLDRIREQIQAGKLKGSVSTGRIIKSARIEESSQGLRAFVTDQADTIFAPALRIPLKRIATEGISSENERDPNSPSGSVE